jgi:hypothetical protein
LKEIHEINSVEDALEIVFSFDEKEKSILKNKEIFKHFFGNDEELGVNKKNYKFPFPFGIWFRGVSKEKYGLIPSVFRRDENTNKYYRESALFNSFKLYNPSYSNTHTDNLAWLTLMQHYDLPTRLLDWTENILTGLYFAVNDANPDISESKLPDGCLYMLNAERLNRATRFSPTENGLAIPTSVEPQIFSLMAAGIKKKELLSNIHHLNLFQKVRINNQATINWLKGINNDSTNKIGKKMRMAVAVFPQRINARMHAQQSMFTIHGGKIGDADNENENIGGPISLEELNKGQMEGEQFLLCFKIPGDKKCKIFENLGKIGIDERSLYPDIDKQAGYLKKIWQRGEK